MPKLRVLIVDDAVVVRKVLADTLSADPDIEVVTASNGRLALAKLSQVNPDLVTLDMEMPELDGLGTLKEIRKISSSLPVIMFSTLTERGASVTFDALAAGANDYVTKPANVGSIGAAIAKINEDLIPKIKALCKRKPAPTPTPAATLVKPSIVPAFKLPTTLASAKTINIVAIGLSTGGPSALAALLPAIPKDFPVPIVIVQHMPPVFTRLLAERLAAQSQIHVEEGVPGTVLRPGMAVIAAGGSHMTVKVVGGRAVIETNMLPPENSCRPAVDVLFRSIAEGYGASALGVILTGMGSDGLRGAQHMHEAGASIIVQDEASSVVWGMPGFVANAGIANRILPLPEIAGELVRRARSGRGAPPPPPSPLAATLSGERSGYADRHR